MYKVENKVKGQIQDQVEENLRGRDVFSVENFKNFHRTGKLIKTYFVTSGFFGQNLTFSLQHPSPFKWLL